jgi:hypothetical protein
MHKKNGPGADGVPRPLVSELRAGGLGGGFDQPRFLHSGTKLQITNPRIVPSEF